MNLSKIAGKAHMKNRDTFSYLNAVYNEVPIIETNLGYIVESPRMGGYKALVDDDMNILYERKAPEKDSDELIDFAVLGDFLFEYKQVYNDEKYKYKHDDTITLYKLSDRIKTKLVKMPEEVSVGLNCLSELRMFGTHVGYIACYSIEDIISYVFGEVRRTYLDVDSGFILIDKDFKPIGNNAKAWFSVIREYIDKYKGKNSVGKSKGLRIDPKVDAFQERLTSLLLSKITINADKSLEIYSLSGIKTIEAVLVDNKYLVESAW